MQITSHYNESMFGDFVKNLRALSQLEAAGKTKPYGFDDDKKNYSDAGSKKAGGDPENLLWMSYTVRDNDNSKERRLDVGYDKSGRISGVRDFTGKNKATGYYGKNAISDFFKNNFDMDATNYTVSSAPVDIYDPDEVPQEYHDKATVFFDSQDDGAFIPSRIFNMIENPGARWFGDRRKTPNSPKPDSEFYDFVKEYRKEKIKNNTADRAMFGTEINPGSVMGRA